MSLLALLIPLGQCFRSDLEGLQAHGMSRKLALAARESVGLGFALLLDMSALALLGCASGDACWPPLAPSRAPLGLRGGKFCPWPSGGLDFEKLKLP